MEELLRISGIIWMALGPLSIISEVITLVALHRHNAAFLSCDVILIFVVTSYMLTSLLVLFIPAVMYFTETSWSVPLCELYTSVSVVLRTSQLIGVCSLCVNWAYLVRIFTEKRRKQSLRVAKCIVFALTAVSILVGVVPYSGARVPPYHVDVTGTGNAVNSNDCRFLAYSLGPGYSLYFIILTSFVFLIVLIVTCDALCIVRNMNAIARRRFMTGRFKISRPKSMEDEGTIATQCEPRTITPCDIRACLKQSSDLCKVVLVVTCCSLILGHLPYMAIQALQLFSDVNTQLLELLTLWLVAADVIITPPTVWLSARRYRYFWTSPSKEGKEIMLKGFVMRGEHNGTVRSSSSPRAVAPENQPRTRSYMSDVSRSYDVRNLVMKEIEADNLANDNVTTAIVETREVIHQGDVNGGIKSDQRFSHTRNLDKNEHTDVSVSRDSNDGNDKRAHNAGNDTEILAATELLRSNCVTNADKVFKDSARNSFKTISNSNKENKSLKENVYQIDDSNNTNKKIANSIPNNAIISPSRKIWMERMRKKHLPTIFVNDAFERDKTKLTNDVQRSTHKKTDSNTSLYYFCSEYHPDNLISSLTGSLSKQEVDTSNMAASFTGSLTSPGVVIREDEVMTQSLTDNMTHAYFGATLKSFDSGLEYMSVDIDDGMSTCDEPTQGVQSRKTRENMSSTVSTSCDERDYENVSILFYNERVKLPTLAENIDSPIDVVDPWWAKSTNPFSDDMFKSRQGVTLSVENLPATTSDVDFETNLKREFVEALDVGYSLSPPDTTSYASTGDVAMPTTNITSYNPFVNGVFSVSGNECSFATQAIIPRLQTDRRSNSSDEVCCENPSINLHSCADVNESYTNGDSEIDNLNVIQDDAFASDLLPVVYNHTQINNTDNDDQINSPYTCLSNNDQENGNPFTAATTDRTIFPNDIQRKDTKLSQQYVFI